MVGTPPMLVARSRSINAIAATGSKRRISTSRVPVTIAMVRKEKQPVTWNNGIVMMPHFCAAAGSGAGTASPRRT